MNITVSEFFKTYFKEIYDVDNDAKVDISKRDLFGLVHCYEDVRQKRESKSKQTSVKHSVKTKQTTRTQIDELAKLSHFMPQSSDPTTGKYSYENYHQTIRIDVYLSKLSVGVLKHGFKQKWYKKQTWNQVEKIFLNPESYT